MRLIRARDYRRMPWKNGGGETVEVAISPAGASLDAFDWRISMARVGTSGPFSRFPGIDRTLAVIEGAGVRLAVAGHDAVTLGRDTVPFAFRGDDPASAELIDGPIDDLNVMTRRTSYRHRLTRIPVAASARVSRTGDLLLLLVRGAASRGRVGGERLALATGDTVLLDLEPGLEIAPARPAELYAIDLWRV